MARLSEIPRGLVAAVVWAAVPAASADEIAPRREAGAERHMRFGTVLDIQARTARMTGESDGETLDQEIPLDHATLRTATALVTERLLAVSGGRVTELERTVHEARHRAELTREGLLEKVPDTDSPLLGRTVRFRTSDTGEPVTEFADDGPPKAHLLDELVQESEPLLFLPGFEVGPGDTWSIEDADLSVLVHPTGSLFPGAGDGARVAGPVPRFREIALASPLAGTESTVDELLAGLSGTVRATYTGAKELDGLRIAEIALEIEASSGLDPTEGFRPVIEGGIDPDIPFDYAHEVRTVLQGRGTLQWNLEDGRLHNLSWKADAFLEERIYLATAFEDPRTGKERTLDASLLVEWSGTAAYEARDERGP